MIQRRIYVSTHMYIQIITLIYMYIYAIVVVYVCSIDAGGPWRSLFPNSHKMASIGLLTRSASAFAFGVWFMTTDHSLGLGSEPLHSNAFELPTLPTHDQWTHYDNLYSCYVLLLPRRSLVYYMAILLHCCNRSQLLTSLCYAYIGYVISGDRSITPEQQAPWIYTANTL